MVYIIANTGDYSEARTMQEATEKLYYLQQEEPAKEWEIAEE